jgi:predicted HAD superfamily Cof-like phosphohydrolase
VSGKVSDHFLRVVDFMDQCTQKGVPNQEVPGEIRMPAEEVRLLRAKLILEEALETVEALGISVYNDSEAVDGFQDKTVIDREKLTFKASHDPNMKEIVDGCCDVSVVTMGTLAACGVPDEEFLVIVDENNLAKVEQGTVRADGKLIKPEGHPKPPIAETLKEWGWND